MPAASTRSIVSKSLAPGRDCGNNAAVELVEAATTRCTPSPSPVPMMNGRALSPGLTRTAFHLAGCTGVLHADGEQRCRMLHHQSRAPVSQGAGAGSTAAPLPQISGAPTGQPRASHTPLPAGDRRPYAAKAGPLGEGRRDLQVLEPRPCSGGPSLTLPYLTTSPPHAHRKHSPSLARAQWFFPQNLNHSRPFPRRSFPASATSRTPRRPPNRRVLRASTARIMPCGPQIANQTSHAHH